MSPVFVTITSVTGAKALEAASQRLPSQGEGGRPQGEWVDVKSEWVGVKSERVAVKIQWVAMKSEQVASRVKTSRRME